MPAIYEDTFPLMTLAVTDATPATAVALRRDTKRFRLFNAGPDTLFWSTKSGPFFAAALTFAEDDLGSGDSSIVTVGDFLAEGFVVGDTVIVAGTASNNGTVSVPIKTLTALKMTFDGAALADEASVSCVATTDETLTTANGFPVAIDEKMEPLAKTGQTDLDLFFICAAADTAALRILEEA